MFDTYRALATILWLSTCQPGLYAQPPPKLSPKLIAVLNEPTKVKDGWATQADLERLRYDKVSVEIALFNAKSAHDHQESALQHTPK